MLSRRRFLLASAAASIIAPAAARAAAEAPGDGIALFSAPHPGMFWMSGDGLYASIGGADAGQWSKISEAADLTEESLLRCITEIRTLALAQSFRETKWNVMADVLNRSST